MRCTVERGSPSARATSASVLPSGPAFASARSSDAARRIDCVPPTTASAVDADGVIELPMMWNTGWCGFPKKLLWSLEYVPG